MVEDENEDAMCNLDQVNDAFVFGPYLKSIEMDSMMAQSIFRFSSDVFPIMMLMMLMTKTMEKHKINCCNTRYRGYICILLFQRHHMIGYSIVSDNAYAPEQSNSIYISKTNQKSSISYITTLRHYRKKFFSVTSP